MVGDISQAGYGKGGPASHIKKFGFSTSQFVTNVIKNKVKFRQFRSTMKDKESKLFPKVRLDLMPKVEERRYLVEERQLEEKITLDLDRLTFWPEKRLKF